MTTYTITPGIACYVSVKSEGHDGTAPYVKVSGWDQSFIFLSHEKGVVFGHRETPMAQSSLPQQVQDSISAHFKHVFSLEHETWRGYPNPSPRRVYCDAAQPWTIEVPE